MHFSEKNPYIFVNYHDRNNGLGKSHFLSNACLPHGNKGRGGGGELIYKGRSFYIFISYGLLPN